MEVINVGLYGGKSIFGGKETKLEASVISCDRHHDCSYYQNNQCLRVRSFGGASCKFGSINNHVGYTSRAQKYGAFKRKWQEHEAYGELSHPPSKLGLIDGYVVFPYPYISLKVEGNKVFLDGPSFGFSEKITFIPVEMFDVELVNRICEYRPEALMGGTIKTFEKETVPLFLSHLEEVLPELYVMLKNKYPVYDKEIDYVGRKAYLKTLNPCELEYSIKGYQYRQFGETWQWDGQFLTWISGYVRDVGIIKDYEVESFVLKPNDGAVVTVTNNEQVNKNTVFKD